MIIYTLSIFCVSICAVAIHILFCAINGEKFFKSDIRKLIYHWRLTAVIWIILVPFVFFVNSYLLKNAWQVEYGIITAVSYSLLLYFMLFFLYLTVYYTIDRSVSSRMMIIVNNRKPNIISKEELFREFDVDAKYHNILVGMRESGFIKEREGRYELTLKGRLVGYTALFFKKYLYLGKGG